MFINQSRERSIGCVETWHANADEVDAIDYNLDFERPQELFDGSIPYRFSDHDPVIATINLAGKRGKCKVQKQKKCKADR